MLYPRINKKKSPYPEEFNRQAIGLTASLHFAPTQKAADTTETLLPNRMGKRQQTDCCDSTQKGKSGRTHA